MGGKPRKKPEQKKLTNESLKEALRKKAENEGISSEWFNSHVIVTGIDD
jgi:hypothetical protein